MTCYLQPSSFLAEVREVKQCEYAFLNQIRPRPAFLDPA